MSNLIFFEIPELKLPCSLSSFSSVIEIFNKFSKKYFHKRFNKLLRKYPEHKIVFVNKEERTNRKSYNLMNFFNQTSIQKIDEEVIKFTKRIGNAFNQIFSDYNLWDLNQLDIVRSFIRPRYHIIKAFEKIIEKEKPKEIVITRSTYNLNIIRKLAKKKNIVVKKEDIYSDLHLSFYNKILSFTLKRFYHREYENILSNQHQYRELNIPKNKRKLLIFSSSERTGRYIEWSKPWYEKLKNSALIFIELNKKSIKLFENNHFYYHLFEEYVNTSLKKKISTEIKQNQKNFDRFFRLNQKGLVVYDKTDITNCFNDLFVYFKNIAIRDIIIIIETTKQVIKKENPNLVVFFGGWRPFSRTISTVLSDNNVKSILVQHGFYSKASPDVRPLKVSKIAAFGPYTKEVLVRKGEEPSKIVVTGQPRFDDLLNKKFDVSEIKVKLKIPSTRKVILYTSGSYTSVMEMKALIDVFYNQTDFQLILKLHPDEKEPEFTNTIKKKENILLIKNFDLYKLIAIADVVITAISTTGLEAMIMRKPIIMLNLINKDDLAGYTKFGAAVGVYKKEDILSSVKKILDDKEFFSKLKNAMKKHVEYHCYKQDGKASERVAKLIESMINS